MDWTGTSPEEEKLEKRWPRIGKKKDKDKILPLTAVAEQQEHLEHLGEPARSDEAQRHREQRGAADPVRVPEHGLPLLGGAALQPPPDGGDHRQ